MSHFNKLTPAEAERLALLSEELGEAVQIVGKILRHGYESYNPKDSSRTTNRGLLEKELGDVRGSMIALTISGDLKKSRIHQQAVKKLKSVNQWLHHNKFTYEEENS